MYEKDDSYFLITTASAVPNNLAVQAVKRSVKPKTLAVIHEGYVNVIPIHGAEIKPKYIPCIPNGTKPKSVTSTVTQVTWCTLRDQQYLVVTSSLGVQVFEDEGKTCLVEYPCSETEDQPASYARGIAVLGNGLLCVGTSGGSVIVLGIPSHPRSTDDVEFVDKKTSHGSAVTDLATSPEYNPEVLVSADESGHILLWRLGKKLKNMAAIQTFGFPCSSLRLWRHLLLAGYGSGHLRMFDCAHSGALLCEVSAHARWITALDVAPEQGYLLSASEDSLVKVWQVQADGNTLTHKFTACVENSMLVGARFLNPLGMSFCVSAYDSNEICTYTMQV